MDVIDAIRSRRSIKQFGHRIPSRDDVEALLELAVQAPNHRMTEPWRFRVMGPEARRAYGEALAARRVRRIDDADAAAAVRRKTVDSAVGTPLMIGVLQQLSDNPEIREEDYAACFMAIQNLCLGALPLGLGAHIHTGAVLNDAPVREALEAEEDERVVALVDLGRPYEVPDAKSRTPAVELTRWIP